MSSNFEYLKKTALYRQAGESGRAYRKIRIQKRCVWFNRFNGDPELMDEYTRNPDELVRLEKNY
ncbi:hypothetical protein [Acetobacterium tundrae]|uniref:Uncharacterized protein n=1 Tax=Acetobacterium tundrae TaxID=132932 RepID=A0ABR6WQ47_9FIRM|nr:hypothetical protein [Acetobacterium tundrae]MBC3798575.1 hypothetical protein [Acetobacterium tundrae]